MERLCVGRISTQHKNSNGSDMKTGRRRTFYKRAQLPGRLPRLPAAPPLVAYQLLPIWLSSLQAISKVLPYMGMNCSPSAFRRISFAPDMGVCRCCATLSLCVCVCGVFECVCAAVFVVFMGSFQFHSCVTFFFFFFIYFFL